MDFLFFFVFLFCFIFFSLTNNGSQKKCADDDDIRYIHGLTTVRLLLNMLIFLRTTVSDRSMCVASALCFFFLVVDVRYWFVFFCLATPAYAMAFHYKILSVGLLCDAVFLGICAVSAMEFYGSSLCFQYRLEQVNFSSVFFLLPLRIGSTLAARNFSVIGLILFA